MEEMTWGLRRPTPRGSVVRSTPCSSYGLAFTKTAKKRISTLTSFSLSPREHKKASVRMRSVQDLVLPEGHGGEVAPTINRSYKSVLTQGCEGCGAGGRGGTVNQLSILLSMRSR